MKHQIVLDRPAGAKDWAEGLFIGNGRLGASILGAVANESIPLNEETIWYGAPLARDNTDGINHIEEIRSLLRAGEIEKATFLNRMALNSTPKYLTPYLPAGNLVIDYFDMKCDADSYKRTLDMDNALVTVDIKAGDTVQKREYFASRSRNVIAIRITSNKPITLSASLNRRPYEGNNEKIDNKTTAMWGQCGVGGISYFGATRIVAKGASVGAMGGYIYTESAEVVELYTTYGTDFMTDADYRANCLARLDVAEELGFDAMYNEHLAEWKELYDRLDFSLDVPQPEETCDIQLKKLREGGDERALCENLFHLGRYLMISGSTDCQLPTTLQGIWNGSYTPSWESKYTININTEMNYWPAEVCNLPECHEALFKFVERLTERGRVTAKTLYGCNGFVVHHNTNIWAETAVEGIPDSAPYWPMGGAWLSLHMYEHYLFTEDKVFLKERALPVMGLAIEFFADYLTDGPNGTLITGPSLSPENTYRSSIGQVGALCMAPTMDSQILCELMGAYITGCNAIGERGAVQDKAEEILLRLPKTEVSTDGRIKEWQEEYEEIELGHRHVSHLFGLHPGTQITQKDTELFAAAKKTLQTRLANGGGHTGWSCAWIINFYARLQDAASVQNYLRKLLGSSTQDNLLDSHPPFQIDGNFGATAGIVEALCQSHTGEIHLLPALPQSWQSGKLTGVRLRGNIGMDIYWSGGELERAILTAATDKDITIRYADKSMAVSLKAGIAHTISTKDFI